MRMPSLRRSPKPPEGFDGVLVLRHGRPYDPAWDLWRPLRRWPGILLSAIVTAALLVAIAYHFEHRVAQAKPAFSVPTGHVHFRGAYFPPVTSTKGVQEFSGKSNAYAVKFTSNGHLSQWNFKCRCVNNFAVTVQNFFGKLVDVPVNTIGFTRSASLANYPPGIYTINVIADRAWSARLIDQSVLTPVATPFSYVSSGSSVLGPFNGAHRTFQAAYIGDLGQLFTVQVFDSHGVSHGYAQFTIRTGSKMVTLSSPPNPYFLSVSGTGFWLINVH